MTKASSGFGMGAGAGLTVCTGGGASATTGDFLARSVECGQSNIPATAVRVTVAVPSNIRPTGTLATIPFLQLRPALYHKVVKAG
jgi:hypothetical protein